MEQEPRRQDRVRQAWLRVYKGMTGGKRGARGHWSQLHPRDMTALVAKPCEGRPWGRGGAVFPRGESVGHGGDCKPRGVCHQPQPRRKAQLPLPEGLKATDTTLWVGGV